MSVLPLFLGWLVLAAEPIAQAPAGYVPTGAPAELYDLGRLALLRDPAVQSVTVRESPEKVRSVPGQKVLAKVDGPGILQRLWIGPDPAKPKLGRKPNQELLRVFLDGRNTPALDISLEDLFSGRHPRFPRPMVGEGPAGFYGYVQIAFRDGCTVVLQGAGEREYQVDLLRLPSPDGVTTFTAIPTPGEIEEVQLARKLWYEPDLLFSKAAEVRKMVILNPEVAEYDVSAGKRATQRFNLPAGPRTIRSLEILAAPQTVDAWRTARLRLVWDGDDLEHASVDLPLGFFYVQSESQMMPHASLFVSHREQRWSNRFPMPYRRQALLQIDSEGPIEGKIRVRSLPELDRASGYFRAAFRTVRGAPPAGGFDVLDERGRGHFVGMFLLAQGPGEIANPLDDAASIFIDGAKTARREGLLAYFNGTKDRPEFAEVGPATGFPIITKSDDRGRRLGAYRWHLTDPIVFARSLSAKLGHDDVAKAAAAIRGAAFWYSEYPGPARAGD